MMKLITRTRNVGVKIGDYMTKKIGHIIQGWGKRLGLIPISKAEDKLAELRMKQCKKCPHSKKSTVIKIIAGKVNNEETEVCELCHCPWYEKTIVIDEYCPINKW